MLKEQVSWGKLQAVATMVVENPDTERGPESREQATGDTSPTGM